MTALSGLACADPATWWMETAPTWIGLALLALTWKRFQFTPIVVCVLALHAWILAVGGHYTYAEVPVGWWLRDVLHLDRNPFDRLGHCFQGITPALVVRELLLRTSPLRPGGWLATLCVAMALGVSALYELIEWYAAVSLGQSAEAFLGTQGDPWDAQADMLCAFIGALLVVGFLARFHSRQLRNLAA